jgi:hypothetical protein
LHGFIDFSEENLDFSEYLKSIFVLNSKNVWSHGEFGSFNQKSILPLLLSRMFDQPAMQTQTPEPVSTHQSMIT